MDNLVSKKFIAVIYAMSAALILAIVVLIRIPVDQLVTFAEWVIVSIIGLAVGYAGLNLVEKQNIPTDSSSVSTTTVAASSGNAITPVLTTLPTNVEIEGKNDKI